MLFLFLHKSNMQLLKLILSSWYIGLFHSPVHLQLFCLNLEVAKYVGGYLWNQSRDEILMKRIE
jgi:hypothetical protein